MKTPYEILEVAPNATAEQIKTSYRRLAKKYHPDVNKASSAHQMFALVNSAFEAVKNAAPPPEPKQTPRQPQRRSTAVKTGYKLYEFIGDNQREVTITVDTDRLPADSIIYLMWRDKEYRVNLKESRLVPFALQLETPPLKIRVKN